MRKMLHHIHAVLFGILLISGFVLHFSFLRGVVAPYRLLLMRTHAYVGELFCLVLFAYFLHLFVICRFRSRNIRFSLLHIASFLTLLSLASTGWLLVHKVEFGTAVAAYSFKVHQWLAYFGVFATLWHFWSVFLLSVPDDMPTNRRRFLS